MGLPKFLRASLPACHGLSTPADLSILANLRMKSCCLRSPLCPRHPQHPSFEAGPALQGARTLPYGLQNSLSTLQLSCSPENNSDSATAARLDTERMANPSPTGTFTLQDTPNLAWRETVLENSGGFRPLLLPGWTLFFLASLLVRDHFGLLKNAVKSWSKRLNGVFVSLKCLVSRPPGVFLFLRGRHYLVTVSSKSVKSGAASALAFSTSGFG